MDDPEHPVRTVTKNKPRSSASRCIVRSLLVLLAGLLGFLGGFLTGSGYGGNHAPGFSFLGMPGYEGSGLMAGIVSSAALVLVVCLLLALRSRTSSVLLAIAGGLVAVLLGAPLLFPVIAPATGLLAVVYAASACIGALLGLALGMLRPHRKTRQD